MDQGDSSPSDCRLYAALVENAKLLLQAHLVRNILGFPKPLSTVIWFPLRRRSPRCAVDMFYEIRCKLMLLGKGKR